MPVAAHICVACMILNRESATVMHTGGLHPRLTLGIRSSEPEWLCDDITGRHSARQRLPGLLQSYSLLLLLALLLHTDRHLWCSCMNDMPGLSPCENNQIYSVEARERAEA
jgi:hypothetical protein